MKVTDLMVGDWVSLCNPADYGRQVRVQAILDKSIVCDNKRMMITMGYIQPIPLTESILLKNGFEKTTNDWNRHGRPLIIFESMEFPTISIHADMDMKHFWVHGTIDLTYVHQLQHLLRLVGVQKEIEL